MSLAYHPSRLLSIPLELRLKIYEHLLVLPEDGITNSEPSVTKTATTVLTTPTKPQPKPKFVPGHRRARSLDSSNTTARSPALLSVLHTPPKQDVHPRVHTAILSVCRTTYHEAITVLYGCNTFLAHPQHLTTFPRLRSWYSRPVTAPHLRKHIRRWHMCVQLDAPVSIARGGYDVAATFSNSRELVLHVQQRPTFMFGGAGIEALRPFERVRGVRGAKVMPGATLGYEGYCDWLSGAMTGKMVDVVGVGGEGGVVNGYVAADVQEQKRLSGWGPVMLVGVAQKGDSEEKED